ncbi:MAG: transposase [Flavobacteriales bacterium Tduv]
MIRAVHISPANEHDSRGQIPLLSKLWRHKNKDVYANNIYKVVTNVGYLEIRDIKDRIYKNAYRNPTLSRPPILFDKLVSKTCWMVERTFVSIKHWFRSGKAPHKGLDRVYFKHLMEAMEHNLYCAPRMVMPFIKIYMFKLFIINNLLNEEEKDKSRSSPKKSLLESSRTLIKHIPS